MSGSQSGNQGQEPCFSFGVREYAMTERSTGGGGEIEFSAERNRNGRPGLTMISPPPVLAGHRPKQETGERIRVTLASTSPGKLAVDTRRIMKFRANNVKAASLRNARTKFDVCAPPSHVRRRRSDRRCQSRSRTLSFCRSNLT